MSPIELSWTAKKGDMQVGSLIAKSCQSFGQEQKVVFVSDNHHSVFRQQQRDTRSNTELAFYLEAANIRFGLD